VGGALGAEQAQAARAISDVSTCEPFSRLHAKPNGNHRGARTAPSADMQHLQAEAREASTPHRLRRVGQPRTDEEEQSAASTLVDDGPPERPRGHRPALLGR